MSCHDNFKYHLRCPPPNAKRNDLSDWRCIRRWQWSLQSLYSFIASLPRHTVYQPGVHTLPPLYTLPVILWGNGRCRGHGGWFSKALTEIPSHGSFIIPNGVPQRSGIFSTTKNPDIPNDIDCICRPRRTGAC
ncbi:hypothetical protein F5882DRAFT_403349 [Hyaloscypha sp. PMI_1271]|nr:hypothetical protein F5882DRAFT_403349 [Hyaloscypha sp. PMI_1271]